MENIKIFDAYAGYIFEKIYKNFPLCVDFAPYKEIEAVDAAPGEEIERKVLIFCATILWLERNGFIRIAMSEPTNRNAVVPLIYRNFMCVELTIEGLNLLTSPAPKTLDKKSVGEEIVKKVKSGMFTEAGKIATKAMFEYGVKKVIGEA